MVVIFLMLVIIAIVSLYVIYRTENTFPKEIVDVKYIEVTDVNIKDAQSFIKAMALIPIGMSDIGVITIKLNTIDNLLNNTMYKLASKSIDTIKHNKTRRSLQNQLHKESKANYTELNITPSNFHDVTYRVLSRQQKHLQFYIDMNRRALHNQIKIK